VRFSANEEKKTCTGLKKIREDRKCFMLIIEYWELTADPASRRFAEWVKISASRKAVNPPG